MSINTFNNSTVTGARESNGANVPMDIDRAQSTMDPQVMDVAAKLREMYLAGFEAGKQEAQQEIQAKPATRPIAQSDTPPSQRRAIFNHHYSIPPTQQQEDPFSITAARASLLAVPPPPPQDLDQSSVSQPRPLNNSTNTKYNGAMAKMGDQRQRSNTDRTASLLREQLSRGSQESDRTLSHETAPTLSQAELDDLYKVDDLYRKPLIKTPPGGSPHQGPSPRTADRDDVDQDYEALYTMGKLNGLTWKQLVGICRECLDHDRTCSSTRYRFWDKCTEIVAQDALRREYNELRRGRREDVVRQKVDILCRFASLGNNYPDTEFLKRAKRVHCCRHGCGLEKILASPKPLTHYTCEACAERRGNPDAAEGRLYRSFDALSDIQDDLPPPLRISGPSSL